MTRDTSGSYSEGVEKGFIGSAEPTLEADEMPAEGGGAGVELGLPLTHTFTEEEVATEDSWWGDVPVHYVSFTSLASGTYTIHYAPYIGTDRDLDDADTYVWAGDVPDVDYPSRGDWVETPDEILDVWYSGDPTRRSGELTLVEGQAYTFCFVMWGPYTGEGSVPNVGRTVNLGPALNPITEATGLPPGGPSEDDVLVADGEGGIKAGPSSLALLTSVARDNTGMDVALWGSGTVADPLKAQLTSPGASGGEVYTLSAGHNISFGGVGTEAAPLYADVSSDLFDPSLYASSSELDQAINDLGGVQGPRGSAYYSRGAGIAIGAAGGGISFEPFTASLPPTGGVEEFILRPEAPFVDSIVAMSGLWWVQLTVNLDPEAEEGTYGRLAVAGTQVHFGPTPAEPHGYIELTVNALLPAGQPGAVGYINAELYSHNSPSRDIPFASAQLKLTRFGNITTQLA